MSTILLIEDDTALRNGLAFDLSAEGYHILSAENGKTAITFLEQPVDLVLLDINLPDTDGFLLCCEIKKQKNIPVVFLTCRDLESDEICGFDCGADDYVTKPFSMPLLRKRIAEKIFHLRLRNISCYKSLYQIVAVYSQGVFCLKNCGTMKITL